MVGGADLGGAPGDREIEREGGERAVLADAAGALGIPIAEYD